MEHGAEGMEHGAGSIGQRAGSKEQGAEGKGQDAGSSHFGFWIADLGLKKSEEDSRYKMQEAGNR